MSGAYWYATLKDYVWEKILLDLAEEMTVLKSESFLKPRVEEARAGEFSDKSLDDIFGGVAVEKDAD